MNKYDVEFSYVICDEDDKLHDGGQSQFSIEADSKDEALKEAYTEAMFTDDVEKIVDMTITCKETGDKYNLNDVEDVFNRENEELKKKIAERKVKWVEKYKNDDRIILLKKLFENILKDFKNDVENEIKELSLDKFIANFCVYIEDEHVMKKFDNAPSDNCKLNVALQLCQSICVQENSDLEEPTDMDMEIELLKQYLNPKLSIEDFKYLQDKVSEIGAMKQCYFRIIEKLENNEKIKWNKVFLGGEIFLVY